jgi:hypothetical protein
LHLRDLSGLMGLFLQPDTPLHRNDENVNIKGAAMICHLPACAIAKMSANPVGDLRTHE